MKESLKKFYHVFLRESLRFLSRLSYAISIAVFVWFFHNRGGMVFKILSMILDLPVAIAGRVAIESRWLKGIDLFFGVGVGEFMPRDQVLHWHLRATILVYLTIFYGWDIARRLYKSKSAAGNLEQ